MPTQPDDALGAGVLLLTIVGSYLLIAGLSLPLILQKVPPNRFYGFRSKRTLGDEEVWYRVNRLGGGFLVLSSLGTLVASLVPVLSAGLPWGKGDDINLGGLRCRCGPWAPDQQRAQGLSLSPRSKPRRPPSPQHWR